MARSLRLDILWLACVTVAALVIVGCGSSAEGETIEADADGLPVVQLPARYASALADDPETLAASFDTAFAGEVIGEAEQRSVQLGEGGESPLPLTVFFVRVEASSGAPAVGSVVEMEQLGGVTSGADGPVRVLLEGDTPIAAGQRYVFIARQDGPKTFSAAAFARFPVEDGLLSAPEGWEETGASRGLAGLTVDEAMARLEQ